MDPAVLYKIYELKGVIDSISELSNYGDEFDHPMIDTLQEKINGIVQLIENEKSAAENCI